MCLDLLVGMSKFQLWVDITAFSMMLATLIASSSLLVGSGICFRITSSVGWYMCALTVSLYQSLEGGSFLITKDHRRVGSNTRSTSPEV